MSDGTTDRAQLQNTVDAAASSLRERFGLAAVYPSYTDKSVRRKLRRRDGIRTDDVQEALERARTDGFLYIFVQPFYITDCREYRKMLEEVDARIACGCYAAAEAGRPLITSREDVRRAADVLADELPDVGCDHTGIFLMGCDGSDGEKRILQNLTEDLNERIPERFFSVTIVI